jgi:hypothetical protein
MDQFSHEELQKVIRKYDEEHKKNASIIMRNQRIFEE